MKRPSTVAIAGIPRLIAGAIMHIARETAITPSYRNGDGDDAELDAFDMFIVGPELFISRLDFFLPRKQRVAVVFSGTDTGMPMPVTSIYESDEPETVAEKLRSLFLTDDDADAQEGQLTARETDVLKEIASGKTNKEIAEALNISVNTAISHRKNITRKLGIRSASGLSLYALMNGLVALPSSE